jgi:Protein of unknown function (DUF664)
MLTEIDVYLDSLKIYLNQFKDVLDEIGDDLALLNWRPSNGELSSIFGITAFTALNIEYWIGHVIGGRSEPPGYDSVLEEANGSDPLILQQLLDSALETSREVVENYKSEDLDTTFNYADEFYSARWCILQAIQETAQRFGQVEVLLQWKREQ